jgi:hypothetical protein
LKMGTLLRALTILMLLLAASQSGMANPRQSKDATGCTLVEDTRPSWYGCIWTMARMNCYSCTYSDDRGLTDCWESPDGEIQYCSQ